MKKLLALALALTLTLSLSVTAFAADATIEPGNDGNPNPSTGKTTVTYEVQPAYTVTIPATVAIGGDAVTVSASGVKVSSGKQVTVKLTGINVTEENTSGDNTFTVKTAEGASLNYTVTAGESGSTTQISKGGTVLTVNPGSATDGNGASGSTTLTFALASDQTVKYAGTYSGTVTFTVSVDSVTP